MDGDFFVMVYLPTWTGVVLWVNLRTWTGCCTAYETKNPVLHPDACKLPLGGIATESSILYPFWLWLFIPCGNFREPWKFMEHQHFQTCFVDESSTFFRAIKPIALLKTLGGKSAFSSHYPARFRRFLPTPGSSVCMPGEVPLIAWLLQHQAPLSRLLGDGFSMANWVYPMKTHPFFLVKSH